MRHLFTAIIATVLMAGSSQAQTLERIQQTKQINIGFRADAVPLSYVNDSGKPAGYSVLICDHLAQAIATELNLEDLNATFLTVDTSDRFDRVASGEIDILCGAASITLTRREKVDFSIPTYVDGTSLLLPKDAGENLSDLVGKKIGLRGQTTTETAVQNSLQQAGIEAQIVPFVDHKAGFQAMAAGEIDAYFADQTILLINFAAGGLQEKFKMSDQILTLEKHGLAIARGDGDFRLLVDRVLSRMYADGTMEELFKKTLPGIEPGRALQALHLIAPTLP